MKTSKSFTFKVAQTTESTNNQLKVREGVANAGCSMVTTPWGAEPKCNGYHPGTDSGAWC
ncbi:MAG TPA: hypothetical protein DCR93_12165 [Cytophagales bacterium]|nr:hypothetical protein [Cytophagales bacterium]HAP60204.1 hypothetical protein [Cytophagales bacterium]